MNASDLAAENAQLRAELKGFEEGLAAFVEAAEGLIEELDVFPDACAADPALHARARALVGAAAERMHGVIHTIGTRFPTYRGC